MEIRQLETLLSVARLGGLSRAADELGIAPSTAALHLADLGRELGVRLTERAGRGIRLTTGGRRLLEPADSVVMAVGRLRSAAGEVREGRAARLLVGAIEPTASRRLPAVLAGFCQERPSVEVRVQVAGTAALCQAVAEGALDLAICSAPPRGSGLGFEPLFLERLDLLVPAQHPLATAQRVRARDLVEHRLLVTEETCAYRRTVVETLSAAGVVLGRLLELGSASAVAGAVACGLGIAFVPLGGADPPAGTVRRELEDLPTALAVGVVAAEHRPLPATASELVKRLRASRPTPQRRG